MYTAIKNAVDKNLVFGLPKAAEIKSKNPATNIFVKVFWSVKSGNGQKWPKRDIFRFMCTLTGPENGAIKNAADKNLVFGLP